MGKTNGAGSIVKLVWILFGIAAIFVSIGCTYGTLNARGNETRNIALEAKTSGKETRSLALDNRESVIKMESNINYIVKSVDEIKDKM